MTKRKMMLKVQYQNIRTILVPLRIQQMFALLFSRLHTSPFTHETYEDMIIAQELL